MTMDPFDLGDLRSLVPWAAFVFGKSVTELLFRLILLLLRVIGRPATVFATYKASFAARGRSGRDPRCVAKLVVALATGFESAFPILAIREIYLIILDFVKVALLHWLMYGLVVDNRGIEIIDEAGCVPWRVCEAGGECGMASTGPNDVFSEVYSAVICRIHASLYSIELRTELTKAFGCG